MRFIFAILAVWFAICLIPDPRAEVRAQDDIIEEKVWLSRTCTGSRWYLADSDDSSVTVHCDPQVTEDGN